MLKSLEGDKHSSLLPISKKKKFYSVATKSMFSIGQYFLVLLDKPMSKKLDRLFLKNFFCPSNFLWEPNLRVEEQTVVSLSMLVSVTINRLISYKDLAGLWTTFSFSLMLWVVIYVQAGNVWCDICVTWVPLLQRFHNGVCQFCNLKIDIALH
jgi:hypothetical protein